MKPLFMPAIVLFVYVTITTMHMRAQTYCHLKKAFESALVQFHGHNSDKGIFASDGFFCLGSRIIPVKALSMMVSENPVEITYVPAGILAGGNLFFYYIGSVRAIGLDTLEMQIIGTTFYPVDGMNSHIITTTFSFNGTDKIIPIEVHFESEFWIDPMSLSLDDCMHCDCKTNLEVSNYLNEVNVSSLKELIETDCSP